MTDDLYDGGLSARGLWLTSWLLGVIAVGSLVRLLAYAGDASDVQAEALVWVLLGAIAAAFSAACAVLAGVKETEHRLTYHLQQPARD